MSEDFVVTWGRTGFDVQYLTAFAAGLIILLIFAFERFNTPAPLSERFVERIVPKHLVDQAEYIKAFLIYVFLLVAIYTFLSLLGPHLEVALTTAPTDGYQNDPSSRQGLDSAVYGPAEPAAPWIPLAIVLCLSGVATHYETLNKIELSIRRLTHRIIGIPDGIAGLANRVSATGLDTDALNERDRKFILERYQELMDDNSKTVSDLVEHIGQSNTVREYIRLRFLFDRLENRRQHLDEGFDKAVLSIYADRWASIKSNVFDLSHPSNLALLRTDSAYEDDPERYERINQRAQRVSDTLDDMHVLIAIGVAGSSRTPGSVSRAMRSLGLAAEPLRRDDLANGVIVSMGALFASVLVMVFITPDLIHAMNIEPSRMMPDSPSDALSWATSALCMHGMAAWAAVWMTRRRSWRPMHLRTLHIPALQYARVLLRSYLAAVLGLMLWWWAKEAFSGADLRWPSVREAWIPLFASLGSWTGLWVAYALDVARRPRRKVSPWRIRTQPLAQAVTTGLLAYFLISVLLEARQPEDNPQDFKIYIGIVAGVQGLVLGYMILLFARYQDLHSRLAQRHQDAMLHQAQA